MTRISKRRALIASLAMALATAVTVTLASCYDVLDIGIIADNDPTPATTCTELDKSACSKILECFTLEQLSQLGLEGREDVAGCLEGRELDREMRMVERECDNFTETRSSCSNGRRFDAEKASSCADSLFALTCQEFMADPSPGDCNLICQDSP